MGDISAHLKVRVKGTKLAIRDFWTSDPYVVLKLHNQAVKTRLICRNLNPVWNQELTLSTSTANPGTLKVEVFDKDIFSADDKMGDAEIDLRPLATSASAMRRFKSGAKNHKLLPAEENCLAKESCIQYVDGNAIQDTCLRLRDVESGELEMQLKWVHV